MVQCRGGSFKKVTFEDHWMLDMAANGKKINLAHYMMDKIIITLREDL